MTPKEKAQELIEKFSPLVTTWDSYYDCPRNEDDVIIDAKKCALIAVDMAIEKFVGIYNSLHFASVLTGNVEDSANYKYWNDVKDEINKL